MTLAPLPLCVESFTLIAEFFFQRKTSHHKDELGRVKAYLTPLRADFAGTILIQGGITTQTIPQAVQLGAEFLVAGTQIFRGDQLPGAVITAMLQQAAEELSG